MLRTRLLVAAIGLPLLALTIALPEPVFAAAVSLLLAAAAAELFVAAAGTRPVWQPLAAAAATALAAAWMRQAVDGFPLWTLLPLPAIALYGLLRPGPGPRRRREAWWLGAVAYLGILGAHWLLLRGEPEGQRWLIVLLSVTFAADAGAYAVGKLIGRHPLAPRISPGKTREGAIGGFLAGATAGAVLPIALDLGAEAVLIRGDRGHAADRGAGGRPAGIGAEAAHRREGQLRAAAGARRAARSHGLAVARGTVAILDIAVAVTATLGLPHNLARRRWERLARRSA